MEKITWTWRKIVSLVCGFLGIGTLVSCYGMPPEYYELYDNNYASGYVYGDTNGDGEIDEGTEVVSGIKVTAYYPDYTPEEGEDENDPAIVEKNTVLGSDITDENGFFDITFERAYPEYDFIFKLEDIDGDENGSFKTKIVRTDGTSFKLDKNDSE